MKSFLITFIAGSTLGGCALTDGVARDSTPVVAPNAATSYRPDTSKKPPGYSSALVDENRYEVTYAGPWLGSRDPLEGGLLYRAALLAKEHGSNWFRFLHMPGENGPLSHPARPAPTFGSAYGHWQPHWSYRTMDGWQPWHPEWGDRFWAERLATSDVQEVEVHAMVELGTGPFEAQQQTDFEVSAVLKDLAAFRQ